MNIALVGTGKTGQAIDALARTRGHDVVARFDSSHPFLDAEDEASLRNVDVFIDFSTPELALAHIGRYIQLNACAVIGTTGWYDQIGRVRAEVAKSRAALLYAPNFSMGVAVLTRLVEAAGALVDRLPEYDAYIHEVHHRMKLDSPSGTAIHLGEILLDRLSRKTTLAVETQHQAIDSADLHVTSTRAGHVFGRHTVSFDSAFDHIELSHQAKSREGFAFGALRAAEWLPGKTGLFTLDDLLAEWLAQ